MPENNPFALKDGALAFLLSLFECKGITKSKHKDIFTYVLFYKILVCFNMVSSLAENISNCKDLAFLCFQFVNRGPIEGVFVVGYGVSVCQKGRFLMSWTARVAVRWEVLII